MSLGRAGRQGDLLDDITRFCDARLAPDSIYAFLHRERDHLFPDELFEDLFANIGRRSTPPSVVATVMVLQKLNGLSDRDAVERYSYDARWRYAAGVGGYEQSGDQAFVHTVLVDMRERLRRSSRPERVFEVVTETATKAGLVGRRRVLDSTPLYDAVATMDTITLIRSAMRGLLAEADAELEARLRAVCSSGDDYASSAKPQIDWEDKGARDALIDSRARDGFACLELLEGADHGAAITRAAELLAAVLGQDLEPDGGGGFRIARRVARDRIISTVDPETRHGHKTKARAFDGYKGHIAIDPESEIITATAVTAGNTGDAAAAEELLEDCLPPKTDPAEAATTDATNATMVAPAATVSEVFGDAAYGTGELVTRLQTADVAVMLKVQPPTARHGYFSKDAFVIDLEGGRVICPENVVAPLQERKNGMRVADFGAACGACPLLMHCTTSASGRSIQVGKHEAQLTAARTEQRDPGWKQRYRETRPKVERKLAHLMQRRHGGRQARVRGRVRVAQDFSWLSTSRNLARMAVLGVSCGADGSWVAKAA